MVMKGLMLMRRLTALMVGASLSPVGRCGVTDSPLHEERNRSCDHATRDTRATAAKSEGCMEPRLARRAFIL